MKELISRWTTVLMICLQCLPVQAGTLEPWEEQNRPQDGFNPDEFQQRHEMKLAMLENTALRMGTQNQETNLAPKHSVPVPEEGNIPQEITLPVTHQRQTQLNVPAKPNPVETLKEGFDYYPDGLLKSFTDAEGRKTEYFYDAAKQIIKISYADGSSVSFTYDANGNRISMTDKNGTTKYKYDEFNRLIEVTDPSGNTIKYGYDLAGNLISVTDPTGEVTRFQYDADNRLTAVITKDGTTAFAYDVAGNLAKKVFPNRVTLNLSYDKGGRLTDMVYTDPQGKLIVGYHYTLDAVGNRTEFVEETPDGKKMTKYFYDALDQLVKVIYPNGDTYSYEYDAAGNRIKMITPTGPIDYQYDTAGRLVKAGDIDYFWDKNGNLIREKGPEGETNYTWDAQNLLVNVTTPKDVIEFVYDGDGNRVAKVVNGVRTNYVNDINSAIPQVFLETGSDGKVQKKYLLAGADRIGVSGVGGDQFYLADGLGSTTGLLDSKGEFVAQYDYDVFGSVKSAKGPAAGTNDFLFTGEQMDPETGLIYLRSRYYDPQVGRFISRDVFPPDLTDPQTLNEYVYVGNNPVNSVDPLGFNQHRFIDRLSVDVGVTGRAVGRGGFNVGIKTNINGLYGYWGSGISVPRALNEGFGFSATLNYSNPIQQSTALDFTIRGGSASPANPFGPGGRFSIKYNLDKNNFSFAGGAGIGMGLGTALTATKTFPISIWGRNNNLTGQPQNRNTPFPPSGGGRSSFGGRFDVQSSAIRGMTSTGHGGVDLNKSAEVMVNLNDIAGATFDEKTGQLILLGQQNLALPSMKLEDLLVAIRSVFANQDPGVTIGTQPSPVPGQLKVGYFGLTEETRFGKIMFEADRLMKNLSFGFDNETGQPFRANVPGYKSLFDLHQERILAQEGFGNDPPVSSTRMWFVPKDLVIEVSQDGRSMFFSKFSVEVLTETQYSGKTEESPVAKAFAEHLTTHFDEYAKEFPVLEELKQLAKIVGIVKWIKDNKIPVDLSWLGSFPVPKVNTPGLTPQIVQSRDTRIGLTIFNVTYRGGVDLTKDPKYVIDTQGRLSGLNRAVVTSQLSETTLQWNVNLDGRDFKAIALNSTKVEMVGNFSFAQTDFVAASPGLVDLNLTRFYNSLDTTDGPLGKGWSVVPYHLEFPSAKVTYLIGDEKKKIDLYPQIKVVNDAAGKEEIFEFKAVRVNRFRLPQEDYIYESVDPGSTKKLEVHPGFVIFPLQGIQKGVEELFSATLFESEDGVEKRFSMRGDLEGLLTRLEDINGNSLEYTYDSPSRRLLKISDGKREIKFQHDGDGRISSAKLPTGQEILYQYDLSKRFSKVLYPNGDSLGYEYNGKNRLTKVRDSDGNLLVQNQYDDLGRLTDQKLLGEGNYNFSHDLRHGVSLTKDPLGVQAGVQFDEKNRPMVMVDPLGNKTQIQYGVNNRPTALTDPLGNKFTLGYKGDRPSQLFLNGNPLLGLEYDGKGNVIATKDALGHRVSFRYDGNGNQIEVKSATGITMKQGFDELSRWASLEDPLGNFLRIQNNDFDLPIKIENPFGATQLEYDSRLNLIASVDPMGRRTGFRYDGRGNLLAAITPSGNSAEFSYDTRGNLEERKDLLGNEIDFEYDSENRPIGVLRKGPAYQPWDLNKDSEIDIFDITLSAKRFGKSDPAGDVNGDGAVDILDLVSIASHFGERGLLFRSP